MRCYEGCAYGFNFFENKVKCLLKATDPFIGIRYFPHALFDMGSSNAIIYLSLECYRFAVEKNGCNLQTF